ncbi:MAG: hypothetical protein KAT05_12895 [Spirochaetes bacterium]|nr:hypothetical protein [Spirochaetota bacterium]
MVEYNLAIVAITLSVTVYLLTKFFALKEVREKKKGMMFKWVHETLTEDVYIPACTWTFNLSRVLLWKDSREGYRERIFLYRLSKLLKNIYNNRKIVGDDIFFTTSKTSNYYLSLLSESIIKETNNVFDFIIDKNKTEIRVLSIEFLAKLGESQNFMEFDLHLRQKNLQNNDLTKEIETLIDNLMKEHLIITMDQYQNSIHQLFQDELMYKWTRAKLYIYCCLFNQLMSYELYKMYESWYEESKEYFNREKIHKHIVIVNDIIKQTEKYYEEYINLAQTMEGYELKNTTFLKKKTLKEIGRKINKKILLTDDVPTKELLEEDKKFIEFKIKEEKIKENLNYLYNFKI